MNEMHDIHADSDATYGSPRMTRELRRRGYCVNHKRNERLMALHGIVGVAPRRSVRTTSRDDLAPPLADLIGGDLSPRAPTSVAGVVTTSTRSRSLSTDARERRSVGALQQRHSTPFYNQMDQPVLLRPVEPRQYLSGAYRALCERLGVAQSAGRVATCFDNSAAESLFSSLKRELVHRYHFATRTAAIAAITAWIKRYSAVRLHSTIGYIPPIEWEIQYRHRQHRAA